MKASQNSLNRFLVFILLIGGLFSLSSCNALWLKFSGVLHEKPELKTLSNGSKEVLYLPLHHIGREIYYKDIAHKSDSLRKLGYVIFYENVSIGVKDTNTQVTLAKKFRKIQGDFGAANGYLDTVNHKIYGHIAYDTVYKLINQPSFNEMGLDSSFAFNVDVTLKELIHAFEAKYGAVELDSCDINTVLDATYSCGKPDAKQKKRFRKEYVLKKRNENLAQEIKNHHADKIFVIYGAMHFKGLVAALKESDKDWKEQ